MQALSCTMHCEYCRKHLWITSTSHGARFQSLVMILIIQTF